MDEKVLKQLADGLKKKNSEAIKAYKNLQKIAQGQGEEAEKAKGILNKIQNYLTQKAAHGTKLNYFKSLKNQCAEDEEVVYYKKGGSVGCGCKKKKEDGGEITKAKKGTVVDKFKNRNQQGNNTGPITQDNPSWKAQKPAPKFKNDYSSKKVKDSEKDYLEGKGDHKVKEKCGGKVKKQQHGGPSPVQSPVQRFRANRNQNNLAERQRVLNAIGTTPKPQSFEITQNPIAYQEVLNPRPQDPRTTYAPDAPIVQTYFGDRTVTNELPEQSSPNFKSLLASYMKNKNKPIMAYQP